MKRQKKQKIFMSVMAGILALLMLLPILANILMFW
jgi:predicted nucleic acid-binding Zn ribbon protein